MAVTADGDAGVGPVLADASDQPAQKISNLFARRRLAWAQDRHHRPTRRRVVDVDRQEAALVVVRVPDRELLMAVHDVDRVVDIEDHGLGRLPVALHQMSTSA